MVAGCLDDQSEGAEVLRQWSKTGRIHVVQLDVTKEESVRKLVDYTGKISKSGFCLTLAVICTVKRCAHG